MPNKNERTLVIIKPDGVQRGFVGDIIKRYERTGLKIVALKMTVPTNELVEKHYLVDPEWKVKTGSKTIDSYSKKGKKPPFDDAEKIGGLVLDNLKKFFTASPVVAMIFEGVNAVGVVRKITGATEPLTSDVGTVRGDLTIDSYEIADIDGRAVRNLVHASGTPEEVEKEIDIWFNKGDIIRYQLINEKVLYDVNFNEVLE